MQTHHRFNSIHFKTANSTEIMANYPFARDSREAKKMAQSVKSFFKCNAGRYGRACGVAVASALSRARSSVSPDAGVAWALLKSRGK